MKTYDVYVAACDMHGGIYHYKMKDGKMSFEDKTDLDCPMYIAIKDNKMYVPLRAPFKNCEDSGITELLMNENGKLTKTNVLQSTMGIVACHLTVDDYVYTVNYLSGSVVRLPDKADVRNGKGPNEIRQDASHTHYVSVSPDNKYIFVTDLGADEIVVYTKDLEEFSVTKVPAGHGARHLAYYKDGKTIFCVNELMSTITVFEYADGILAPRETVSILPKEFDGENTAAAIRVKGDYIYASNRGHNSISCLKYENGCLRLLGTTSCGGAGPRDFNFVGDDYIVVTNQFSNNITIFRAEGEKLIKTEQEFSAECPLCIVSREA